MAVAPSEEQGNVSVETETPEAPAETTETTETETDAPAEEKEETETPAETVQELFELPDGRKVDAATLSKEWKENFYPDYTRKSQALAAKETITKPTSPLDDPEYVPKNWAEHAQLVKEATLKEIEDRETARIAEQKSLETAIETQLSDVKRIDPTVNENALFLHATKYGFRDLKVAHQNMKDMSELVKKTQTTTAANIAKRNDPVSVSPGATGARPNPSQFSTAIDYLNALKASGK